MFKSKHLYIGLICFTLSTFSEADSIIEKPPLIIGHGEQRVLNIPELKRYSLGANVVRSVTLPGQRETLLLKGVQVGISDLWVWKQDGSAEHRTIQVEPLHSEKNKNLQKTLSRLEEVEIIYLGPGVVLRGQVYSTSEASKINAAVKAFPKEVQDETELSESLLQNALAKTDAWIAKTKNQNQIQATVEDQNLWIRGAVADPVKKAAIEKQIRSIFSAAKLEITSLPDISPVVHFKVFLLEIRKSKFHSLGISWPAQQQNAFKITSSSIKEALQLDLAIQALEGEGAAKILSNPEIAVRAPGEAELFAGGEFPVRTTTQYSSQVNWKPFGLTLKLKISQVAGDIARLDIATEVSHLNPNITNDPVPGLNANRMKTQVDAKFGIPLFLSGLLQEGVREQARGLPLLKRIPILGLLFSSEDYLNERSELVAILLPNKTPPEAPLDKVTRFTPKGKVPPPRNWITPEEDLALRAAPEYPWNAL